jgi:hypothetical protein
MPSTDPDERRAIARQAALMSWVKAPDGIARTAAARAAAAKRFEEQVDPAGELDPAERARRADFLYRAHMQDLARKAVHSRRRAAALLADAEAADRALAAEAAGDPTDAGA